ncbi:MAG TPA: outer membrane protein assembly factor BamD [Blastocatellia bacterium]|nr:outer membrane protein assembly factor BamD [Blastocatellia bacterium]
MQFKKYLSAAVVLSAVLWVSAAAQGPAKGRIEPVRDEALEVQAKHNLDVARWYFEKRKAYTGARDRLQEIIDTYGDFSRMDEVLFLMGEIHLKLSKKDKAGEYFAQLLKDFPTSEFAKRAQARVDELKGEAK